MERSVLQRLIPAPLRALRWRLRRLRQTAAFAAAPIACLLRAACFTISEPAPPGFGFATPDGLRLRSMRNKFSSFAMRTVGGRDPEMARFIARHVPVGGTFVNAGANSGACSLVAARRIGPPGRLLAFAAYPRTCVFLRANLESMGHAGVRVFQCPLGAQDGRVALAFHGAHSGETHVANGASAPGAASVPMRRLDDVPAEDGIHAIDDLKSDVEGFEIPLLQAAMAVFGSRPRVAVQTGMQERHAARYGHGLDGIGCLPAPARFRPHRIAPDGMPHRLEGAARGEVVRLRDA
jgi:FkbM family methyltransferase